MDQSYREELPPCKDFTPVNIYGKLLRIVAKVSGRIFIGSELCRSEKYIDTASKLHLAWALPGLETLGDVSRVLDEMEFS